MSCYNLLMSLQITPFADQIISLLPPLWAQAGEEYLLKQSILGILSALVRSTQSSSQKYHPLILPLIQSSISPSSETRLYLLEDALDLWSTILDYIPTPASPEIISLAQNLFPMYDVASETLRKALDITESYIYLIPSELLSNVSLLLTPWTSLLGSLSREANGRVTHLIELLIRSADSLGGIPAVQELTSSLLSTAFLPTLLSALHEAYKAHQTTGPNRITPSIDSVTETNYFTLLARLAIASPSLFTSALDAALPGNTIEWLLAEWFAHIDSISHEIQKKLSCMALTALLETGQAWILSRLQSLMGLWSDVVTELMVEDTDEGGNEIKVHYLFHSHSDRFSLS